MQKINILHVIAGLDRCGAETFLMNVYRNIDRDKFQFYFLCYGDKKFDYEEEVNALGGIIIRTPSLKKVGIIKFIKNLKKIMKKYKFDIIHTHTYYNSAIPLLVAKQEKIKLRIVHSHCTMSEYKSSIIKKIYNNISQIIINKYANTFLACSKEAGQALFFKNKKVYIIENGIDLEKFKFNKEKRTEIRNKLGIKDEEIVLGHIGRIEEQKNHKYLINIVNEIVKQKEQYKLLLLGNGTKLQEIKEMCNNLNLKEKVIFLGNVGNVYEIINAFDLFVFPSLFEGLGIVLIESQANGLKCFASTAVPEEANVFNNISYIDLAKSEKEWADIIIKSNKKRMQINFEDCRYDIRNTTKQLIEIYTKDKE